MNEPVYIGIYTFRIRLLVVVDLADCLAGAAVSAAHLLHCVSGLLQEKTGTLEFIPPKHLTITWVSTFYKW